MPASFVSDDAPNLRRRDFLLSVGAAGAAGILGLSAEPLYAAEKTASKARIVIVGAGAAGLSTASRLLQRLDGAEITLIDSRAEHYYQPGFTLVAAGIKSKDYVISRTSDYLPKGASLISSSVAEFDPDAKAVVTDKGQRVSYDYLIVATGLSLEYGLIDGMDTSMIGRNGMGSIYHSPEAAAATWQALTGFMEQGGTGLFLRPATEMKCAGAPLKYAFITDDRLRRNGTRDKARLIYKAQNQTLFSVPIVSEKVRMLFLDRGIDVHYDRVLISIDLGKRVATFQTPEGMETESYDFINVVPPMHAPKSVKESPLSWKTGQWATEGWVEVDKATLRHPRYPEVFAVGDVAGVSKGKTAASVKWQVPVIVDHLLADIRGKTSDAIYNGYTSCPLITRLGRAMLVEFDYDNNLVPSFPGIIAPLEELWATWVIKTMGLKPTYLSMLRGRA
ncbi:MAG: NAD(P)/FAD-dependent oxidoreductase [Betaproteobacteria bacterium]|nr:NAD(P)/FAD-dependent oxidoreductase [Betaproteobacteria bacterium]